jgi:hypothetical protein
MTELGQVRSLKGMGAKPRYFKEGLHNMKFLLTSEAGQNAVLRRVLRFFPVLFAPTDGA